MLPFIWEDSSRDFERLTTDIKEGSTFNVIGIVRV